MRETYQKFIKAITPYQQYIWLIIFLQSLVATLGSLYFSGFGDPFADIAAGTLFGGPGGFTPCELCWYARILMYPITIITIVGMLRKDKSFVNYVLALALPGILLELYHYSLQKFPIFTLTSCSAANPCSAMDVNYLGFITTPFLCLIAFIVISVLAYLSNEITKSLKK